MAIGFVKYKDDPRPIVEFSLFKGKREAGAVLAKVEIDGSYLSLMADWEQSLVLTFEEASALAIQILESLASWKGHS